MDESLKYKIALCLVPGVGPITAKKLIAYCGSPEAVFREKKQALLKIPNVGDYMASAVKQFEAFDRAEKELQFMAKNKIQPLFYLDKEYPARLKHCEDSPIMLFYRGNADLNASKIVGVVGTRNITDYGRDKCRELVEGLVSHQALVVSGLAYGVDTQAHKAAMEHQLPTVGVLGHGLDRIYPANNRALAGKMLENGGLLTDFVSETLPDRENFPRRNRIIAGMVDALIVVEAAKTGGALITANFANTYNRDVFAVPGRTHDVYSQGCNLLIRINKANLLETIADLEYIMNWMDIHEKKANPQTNLFFELTDEEQSVVDVIRQQGEASFDLIVAQTGFNFSKTAGILLNLEFQGVLKPLPGKLFKMMN